MAKSVLLATQWYNHISKRMGNVRVPHLIQNSNTLVLHPFTDSEMNAWLNTSFCYNRKHGWCEFSTLLVYGCLNMNANAFSTWFAYHSDVHVILTCRGKNHVIAMLGFIRNRSHIALILPYFKHEKFTVSPNRNGWHVTLLYCVSDDPYPLCFP